MGLFSKKTDPAHNTVPAHQVPPQNYNNAPHGHHNTRHSLDAANNGRSHRKSGGGMFSRHRSSSVSSLSSSDLEHSRRNGGHGLTKKTSTRNSGTFGSGGGGGLFSRNKDVEDPSISAARERVMMAEQAERDAERALIHAKESVHDAKTHVRNLEVEAQEDARRAKVKQNAARDIGKHSSKLGRKF